ncbi:hypothetical protein [Gordonibacter sp.]|uniref:hypothetical protein n=2 Tax=Gordonibacter sp. TaxID=1968902 RepID=UPI002FCBA03B
MADTAVGKNTDVIPFGAGTFNYGATIGTDGTLTSEGTVFGATKGGGKVSIKPNLVPLDFDCRNVKAVGDYVKAGEEATMEAPFTELLAADVAKYLIGTVTDKTTAKIVESSEVVADGHYIKGLAYIGRSASGKKMIVVFDNAICTSGIELEGKKAEQGAPTVTFECLAAAGTTEDKLPWHVIWPK